MEVTLHRSYALSELATRWTELEGRASGGFFLSWRWIGSWLRTTDLRPLLVTAMQGDTVLALGLLTLCTKRRHFIPVRQLCLHESGSADLDAVMIEHNNFLMADGAPAGLITDIVRSLQSASSGWDEIVLSGVSPGIAGAMADCGLRIEIDRSSPNYGVDLSGKWEEKLSENQRAQIRQSRAHAERIGPLRLERAGGAQQALAFFEKMLEMHNRYWQARGKPGAFASQHARSFHHALIAAPSDRADIELLALTAGAEVLGYLYNFRYGERIYSYQSGFSYSDDNRHRPGLIAHTMAMADAKARGLRLYDFLAGDALYKARLGQLMGTMLWCRAQKNRPLLTLERSARALYRRFRGA
ncbi:MAG TPA: GNAT family N-acetyltransferase [Rhizomicrobium sp.]|nr:GNAT family N-acetyltransferase [Rhizomicrobium sp.]